MRAIWPCLLLALAACDGAPKDEYEWDDTRVLCSSRGDDLGDNGTAWSKLETSLQYAHDHDAVALIHVHVPGVTVSTDRLTQIFDAADQLGLEYFTYDELVEGEPHPGVALVFDDDSVDEWFAQRDLFSQRGVHVSFFVTKYAAMTAQQHDELRQLAADGHAIEAHSVMHLDALAYVKDHSVDDYVTTEVLPSIQVLEDDGYQPTAFAYPYSRGNDAISAVILDHIARVRVGVGYCPR